MCGFVAVVNLHAQGVPRPMIERMLDTIVHRGPDDAGVEMQGPVGLGFRRLAILDLSPQGHQPMSSLDGRYTIVFNGEIYNYLELRSLLESLGHSFRSSGDTEVLLAAYAEWGSACVERLNGMWAFVIHDHERRMLFGSRDRFGMKPLYRWQSKEQVLFASEIKAIRASGSYHGGLNLSSCAAFLYEARLDETRATFFDGIEELPASHSFELTTDGGYREWKYWKLADYVEEPHLDAAEEFAQAFEEAMRLHMRADVPVGVNLSGGLDSTSILCEAARIRSRAGIDQPLMAFCYHDKRFDETRYIDDTLAQTGARMVSLQLGPRQLWDSMPEILAVQDEPVHSMSAMIGYHLTKMARQHGVKVILNGQGADEVLAGYGSYFPVYWDELMQSGHPLRAWREIRDYSAAHGGNAARRWRGLVKPALTAPLKRLAGDYTHRRELVQRRAKARSRDWLAPELVEHLQPVEPMFLGATGLRGILTDSIRRAPLPLYLRIEDRNSMAHSVEARLPFLDHRLVSLAFRLGPEWKTRGPWNKYVLRESMRGRIPESVRSRVDKMGFATNSDDWLRKELREPLLEVLTDPGFRSSRLFRHEQLDRYTREHLAGTHTHTGKLLAAAQFHIWEQQQGMRA